MIEDVYQIYLKEIRDGLIRTFRVCLGNFANFPKIVKFSEQRNICELIMVGQSCLRVHGRKDEEEERVRFMKDRSQWDACFRFQSARHRRGM